MQDEASRRLKRLGNPLFAVRKKRANTNAVLFDSDDDDSEPNNTTEQPAAATVAEERQTM